MFKYKSYWWAIGGLFVLGLLLYLAGNTQNRLSAPQVRPRSSGAVVELLKRQEEGLVDLWNHTRSNALLSQIQLNRRIQKLVASDLDQATSLCQRQRVPIRQQDDLVKWQPKDDRYLLVICTSGQISNHLICLEKHMYFAALLDRALVLPSPYLDYDYLKTLDVAHIRSCLGNNTLLTFQELMNRNRSEIRLLCYMHACYLDEEHERKMKSLGLTWSSKTDAWPEEASLKGYPSHPRAPEILSKFSCSDTVLAIGDVFYADVESKLVSQTGGPLQHTCKTIIRPDRLIVLTAQRFIQTFLGDNFMAFHFRRHGFLKFCNVKNESCFFPVPQAADCISSKLQQLKPQVIYLSTDAADSEINLLQQLIRPGIPLFQRPQHNSREKWDALLQRKGLLNDSQVVAMLDKTICAMAKSFIGTPGSTFTDDILRLRREWGSIGSCDGYLCEGQHPTFVANED